MFAQLLSAARTAIFKKAAWPNSMAPQ